MKRIALAPALTLYFAPFFPIAAQAQIPTQGQTQKETQTQTQTQSEPYKIEQVHAAAGSVLTFYLHARLNPADGDAVDGLPKGSLLRVKMVDSIDSTVNPDGTEFHGTVVSALASEGEVVIHTGSEVQGILALLRSRSHPGGFRYELLITSLTDQGKTYTLTASLNPSFADASASSASRAKPGAKEDAKPAEQGNKSKGNPSN